MGWNVFINAYIYYFYGVFRRVCPWHTWRSEDNLRSSSLSPCGFWVSISGHSHWRVFSHAVVRFERRNNVPQCLAFLFYFAERRPHFAVYAGLKLPLLTMGLSLLSAWLQPELPHLLLSAFQQFFHNARNWIQGPMPSSQVFCFWALVLCF